MSSTQYLGPLRAPAKRFYILDRSQAPGVDAIGENVPYILRDQLSARIRACLPESPSTVVATTLRTGLNSWLGYLKGIQNDTGQRQISNEYHKGVIGKVRVRGTKSKSFPLMDTGFGFLRFFLFL